VGRRGRSWDPSERGQAVVEFSLAVIVFLLLLMGIVDFGRAIYQFNGVSQAAREIARVTSVHPGGTLGTSAETAAVVATQRGLIPNLEVPTFDCVDITGSPVAGACLPGNSVKVTIRAPYSAVTPLLGFLGSFDLRSSTSIKIQ
jgi:hypothetical protein